MSNKKNTSAFILAGGKSSRFVLDKSLYEFDGKPLIKHVVDVLPPVFEDIMIIANETEKFSFLDLPVQKDIIPDLGPIGGIYSSLRYNKSERAFIFACDLPFLDSEFIQYMAEISPRYDVIIPMVSGNYEPLHAIYSESCVTPLEDLINRGQRKISTLFEYINVRTVNEIEIEYYDDPIRMFRNINYQQDIQ